MLHLLLLLILIRDLDQKCSCRSEDDTVIMVEFDLLIHLRTIYKDELSTFMCEGLYKKVALFVPNDGVIRFDAHTIQNDLGLRISVYSSDMGLVLLQ